MTAVQVASTPFREMVAVSSPIMEVVALAGRSEV